MQIAIFHHSYSNKVEMVEMVEISIDFIGSIFIST